MLNRSINNTSCANKNTNWFQSMIPPLPCSPSQTYLKDRIVAESRWLPPATGSCKARNEINKDCVQSGWLMQRPWGRTGLESWWSSEDLVWLGKRGRGDSKIELEIDPSATRAAFQVLSSHMWLVAIITNIPNFTESSTGQPSSRRLRKLEAFLSKRLGDAHPNSNAVSALKHLTIS